VSYALKRFRQFVGTTLLAGVLLVAPIYLAILLLLKAMKSLERIVKPLTRLMPGWFPGAALVSLSLVLLLCFLVGIVLRIGIGQAARAWIEANVFQKIPGYNVIRGMTRQLAGEKLDSTWKPALVEIEEALVPAFIVEEIGDGRFTVFVPSVPTPLAGSVYILTPERVHPLDIPFTHAVKAVTQWGSGSKELVAAMERERTPLVGIK
jgi:uncharacterized membrane protein